MYSKQHSKLRRSKKSRKGKCSINSKKNEVIFEPVLELLHPVSSPSVDVMVENGGETSQQQQLGMPRYQCDQQRFW